MDSEEGARYGMDIQDEVGIASNLSEEVIPKNGQVLDYMKRGKDLEQISLWEYVTCVQKLTISQVSNRKEGKCSLEDDHRVNLNIATALKSMATARAKYPFSEDHLDYKSHLQQICRPEKRLIPVPIGPPLSQ